MFRFLSAGFIILAMPPYFKDRIAFPQALAAFIAVPGGDIDLLFLVLHDSLRRSRETATGNVDRAVTP
jgi:hypothetical protein